MVVPAPQERWVGRAQSAWSVPRAAVEIQVRLVPRALVPSKAKGDLQAPGVSQERRASSAEMAEMASVARRAREVPQEPAVPVVSREAKASACQVLVAVLVAVGSQV